MTKWMPDLSIGQRFGQLTIVGRAIRNGGARTWLCECDCGIQREAVQSALISGKVKSCGCLRSTVGRERGLANTKHGHARSTGSTPEWSAWSNLFDRCENPRCRSYHYYGGRGISICQNWRESFEAFLADMGPRPSPKHSIDRYPDNNGNYEPSNCRWATAKEQAANRRPVRKRNPIQPQEGAQ